MSTLSDRIQAAKERLLVPDLWVTLKLQGAPPRNGVGLCCSPFRKDKHPSLSIYDGGRKWSDKATSEGGDAIDFIAMAEGRDRKDALNRFLALAGEEEIQSRPAGATNTAAEFPDVSGLRFPADDEVGAVAKLRCLQADAVNRMAWFGILRAGKSHGHDVWALVDGPRGQRPRLAEIRRFDGGAIPTRDDPEGVKGLTVRGSKKDWPVGASLLDIPRKWSAVLLCEGMPDFLAAAHFAHMADRPDLCPVSILGSATKTLHSDAIALLAGKRIRAFPHVDGHNAGQSAMDRWAAMIPDANIDAFDFTGLRRRDGKPINDLNDCAVIHRDDAHQLAELLPADS